MLRQWACYRALVADHVHILSRGRTVHSSPPRDPWENEEVKARYLGVYLTGSRAADTPHPHRLG
jgi:ABC-type branched-subunit amino acid transport system ATPase component